METQLSILLHVSLKKRKKKKKKKKWILSTKRRPECFGLARLGKTLFIKKNNPFLLYCRIPSSLTVSYLVLFTTLPTELQH